jgi:carboxyl-terminal processing protease
MNSNNKPLIVILSVVAVGALCACVSAAAVFGYFFTSERFTELIEDPVQMLDGAADPDVIQTQTPLGDDVNLGELFAPLWEARLFLNEDFVEQPVDDTVLAQGAVDGLALYLEGLGVTVTELRAASSAPSAESLAAEAATPGDTGGAFTAFWETWRDVQYSDISIATSYEDLMRASLRGMVDALGDPHTGYMDPFELQQSDLSLEGEYEGIGAWVDTTTEYVTIIAPMEGSPAEEAGLMPGDVVVAVDGMDMTGVDGNVVISYILGPAGSTVVLTIQREGETAPFDVSVVREQIVVPSVESEMLENDIAYLHLFTFGSDSDEELHTALQELMAQDPSGLILDLRNNGGGYLDTAVFITSEFIDSGVVLHEEYGNGERDTYDVLPEGLATDIRLVVLVNQGTASASEILAGAIQDYDRGTLIGETTFGKGSVQISRMLSASQGALRITIAHWLTPEERLIHGIGLEPDMVVLLTEEDVAAELDPQLQAAIDFLSQ